MFSTKPWRKTDVQFEFDGNNYSVDVDGLLLDHDLDYVLTVIDFDAFVADEKDNWVEMGKNTTGFLNKPVEIILQKKYGFSEVKV